MSYFPKSAGALLALTSLGLSACAPAVRDVKTPPVDDVVGQTRAVIADVVKLRGLAEKTPIATRVVDDATFNALFAVKVDKEMRPKDKAHGSAATRAPDAYLGFYDEFTKLIVLREHVPKWASDAGMAPQDLLAHEVVHALQDQHFGIPSLATMDDDDARLATSALLEGDAQLVTEAYHAQRLHQPWRRAALNAFRNAELSPETWVRAGLFSPSLLRMTQGQREAIVFPYIDGMAFASTLFRAGRFDLLDRAFQHPPSSSADILEPERYLAGDHAAVFPSLPVPAGAEVRLDAVLGERGLRTLLAHFLPPMKIRSATLGWNGDRLTEFKAVGGEQGMMLASEWTTEQTAGRFETALRAMVVASEEELPEARRGRWSIVREGTAVGLASAPDAASLVRGLLHIARAAPAPSPPFGPIVVPPPPVSLNDRPELRGVVTGNEYVSRWLGVRSEIPAGFTVSSRKKALELLVTRRAPALAVGSFAVLPMAVSLEETAALEKAFIAEIAASLPGTAPAAELGSGTLTTAFGPTRQRTWSLTVDKRPMTARSLLVKVCGGAASLQWGLLWQGSESEAVLQGWVESFKSEATMQACEDIHREATEDVP